MSKKTNVSKMAEILAIKYNCNTAASTLLKSYINQYFVSVHFVDEITITGSDAKFIRDFVYQSKKIGLLYWVKKSAKIYFEYLGFSVIKVRYIGDEMVAFDCHDKDGKTHLVITKR